MKFQLKGNLPYHKTINSLAAISVLVGTVLILFGEFVIPFYSALLASLFVFDKKKGKLTAVFVSVGVLAADTVFCIFTKQYIPVYNLEATAIAAVVAFAFCKNRTKTEAAVAATLVATVFLILSLGLSAMVSSESFTLEAVVGFYTDLIGSLKEELIAGIQSFAVELPDGTLQYLISEEQALLLFDSVLGNMLAYLIIIGFAVAGVTFKLFSAVALKLGNNEERILSSRFGTTNVFAYFYIILIFLKLFVDSSTTVGLAVSNLYLVLMFVYAYIGFNYLHAIVSMRRSPIGSLVIMLFAILLFSNLAVTLLSMLGLFYTFGKNKMLAGGGNVPPDGSDNNKNI